MLRGHLWHFLYGQSMLSWPGRPQPLLSEVQAAALASEAAAASWETDRRRLQGTLQKTLEVPTPSSAPSRRRGECCLLRAHSCMLGPASNLQPKRERSALVCWSTEACPRVLVGWPYCGSQDLESMERDLADLVAEYEDLLAATGSLRGGRRPEWIQRRARRRERWGWGLADPTLGQP